MRGIHQHLAEQQKVLIKTAIVGLMSRVGKVIVKHPVKSMVAGASGAMYAGDFFAKQRGMQDASTGGTNMLQNQGRVNL